MNGNENEVQPNPSPPPPPPLPSFSYTKNELRNNVFLDDSEPDEVMPFEDLIQRVAAADGFPHEKPFYSHFTHLKPQLQEGPRCGLVALSIATSITDEFVSADELFEEAVSQSYTSQGEMYSVENMASLIDRMTNFKTLVIREGLDCHVDCITQCIQGGGLMLVPYDADCNHSPCCKKGHKAHWAVVCGLVIYEASDEDNAVTMGYYPSCRCVDDSFFKSAKQCQLIRDGMYLKKKARDGELYQTSSGVLYLVGRQGKSRHLGLWSFNRLVASNINLRELSEQQKAKDFVVPEGGVAEGLSGKAILMNLP